MAPKKRASSGAKRKAADSDDSAAAAATAAATEGAKAQRVDGADVKAAGAATTAAAETAPAAASGAASAAGAGAGGAKAKAPLFPVVFATPPSPNLSGKRKPIRVWIDGCFDLMHWGHANAIRQAKELCDYLVVGVHSDADILRHKGPPVMTERERYRAVRACKWVDEVVEGAPYNTELKYLDEYNIDFCVHGEDVTTDESGRDCYYEVKMANRYKTIKRTESVSTTDIVGRMILMTKDHLTRPTTTSTALTVSAASAGSDVAKAGEGATLSQVLGSTKTIVQFGSMAGAVGPAARKRAGATASDVVVYLDGAFDLFHVGHIEALAEARKFGSYLVVGVHDDATVNRVKGSNLPIMNLHERVLSVLSCRYVDEVVIGAPWTVTQQLITAMRIAVVAHGTASDYTSAGAKPPDAYAVPHALGIYREFTSLHPDLTTTKLLERILNNRLLYIERNKRKAGKETAAGNAVTDDPNRLAASIADAAPAPAPAAAATAAAAK